MRSGWWKARERDEKEEEKWETENQSQEDGEFL